MPVFVCVTLRWMRRTVHVSRSPRLELPSGSAIPRRYSLLQMLAFSPPPIGRVGRSLATRLAHRMPAFVARYDDGRRFLVPAGDTGYANVLTPRGYEPHESQLVRKIVRRDDFVFDVGANYGWFSLLMATCVGRGGTVWAFEPAPPAHAVLRENVRRNPQLEIKVLPIALGSRDEEVSVHVFRGLPSGHASVSTLGRRDFETFLVRARTIDGLVRDAGRPPALVKVDVEGSELAVLKGARSTLGTATAPMWLIEVNHETAPAFGYRPSALLDYLASLNDYRAFRVVEGGVVAENEPDTAPHGSSWLCVLAPHFDRLRGARNDKLGGDNRGDSAHKLTDQE
jgi:FkbM family methyltransferase